MHKVIKKILIIALITITIIELFSFYFCKIQANNSKNSYIDTQSKIIQLKEKNLNVIKHYEEKYNSKTYGIVAYILHLFQIYSIPFCLLGILIGFISKEIIGVRHFESQDKGNALIIVLTTIFIILQVLPLVFAVVVKLEME